MSSQKVGTTMKKGRPHENMCSAFLPRDPRLSKPAQPRGTPRASTSFDAARAEEAQINGGGAQTERASESSPKPDAVTAEQGAVTER